MFQILTRLHAILLSIFKTTFKSKNDLLLENVALKQQLSIYQMKKIGPKLTDFDRSFWIVLKLV